jgi:CBS domain containing-hemolysin-like protein
VNNFSVIIITLLFSAFFSGSEMAYLSANKLSLELNRTKYPLLSKITDIFYNNQGIFITVILVGNNIALVIYGIFMGYIIEPLISSYIDSKSAVLLLQTIFSTFVILFTGEFLPKIIFRINPVLSLNIFSIPLFFFYIVLYPITKLTIIFTNFVIRNFFKSSSIIEKNNIIIGRIDLDNLISCHTENIDQDVKTPQEMQFFKKALDFSNTKVRECMVPRTELEAIELETNIEALSNSFINSGFSKILIYKDNIDNIVGYIHVSQLFKKPKKLKNIINPITVVPESMSADKLLKIFTKEHKSIALVVDEFGGTAGITTLEDILEEIFGEIDDEHDTSDFVEIKVHENCYHFSGRIEIDYLNEKYQLDLPASDEYETLAGMVLFYHESIPEPMEEVEIERFKLKILEASKSKIELIELKVTEK